MIYRIYMKVINGTTLYSELEDTYDLQQFIRTNLKYFKKQIKHFKIEYK